MAISDYSTDPDQNVKISGINIAEGCAPSGINNAIRQLMADVKEEQEARTTEDAAQDTAISNAATAAANAQSSANAAQSTADSALEAAQNITVPVTSVNGQTGAVTVGTVRTVNGVSADAAGNVSDIAEIGALYIRFSNGWQILSGDFESIAASDKAISFAKSFSSTPRIVVQRKSGEGTTANVDYWVRGNPTTTGFKLYATHATAFEWIAVGRWK